MVRNATVVIPFYQMDAKYNGGSTLNASFLKGGLLDEIILHIDPLLFGKGIKLFADTDVDTKLKLLDVEKLSEDTVTMHYQEVTPHYHTLKNSLSWDKSKLQKLFSNICPTGRVQVAGTPVTPAKRTEASV